MKTIHPSTQQSFARPFTHTASIGLRSLARWNSIKFGTALLALASLGATDGLASDPVGIYAIVDKVVLEPNETSPERIQIWGAFAIAEGRGETYRNAERGYLYYKLNTEKPTVCRNEWSDLKSVAGTGQIVAFGFRYEEKGKLRKKDAQAENPDVYPIAMGLKKIREEKDYEPLKQLAKLRDTKPKDRGADSAPAQK
jgi:hypothetical protein